MRIALVDDNPVDRMNLRTLLSFHPGIEVVGEADNLASAREMIEAQRPEVVFLDVELGRENGFHLLASLGWRPRIVFTTLHLHYAIQAFEVQAADYLVKPVMPERLARTLERLSKGAAAGAAKAKKTETLAGDDLLVFKQGSERRILAVDRIALIAGDRDYSRVIAADGREYLDTRRLLDWQRLLPVRLFQALDRSTIINLGEVASYRQTLTGGQVTLRNSATPIAIGRAGFKRLEECLDRRIEAAE